MVQYLGMKILVPFLMLLLCTQAFAVPKFGDIDLGFQAKDLLSALGEPDRKGEIFEEMATGEWVQIWNYGKLELSLSSSSKDGKQTVYRIYAQGKTPYSWLGVSVGMPESEAVEILREYRKTGATIGETENGYSLFWEDEWLVFGVMLKDGVVREIFIGPGPE